MTTEPSQKTPRPPGAPVGDFRTTRWTQVSRAKADSPDGRRALEELCQVYYEPVATFFRCQLRDLPTARDLTHDFFASLLAGGAIAGAQRERGRFRCYLLGAVKHFLSHHRDSINRLKRGSGSAHFSLDDAESHEARSVPDVGILSPDAAFDRQWALTVVAHALEALRQECDAEDRGEFFEQVKPWLTGEAAHGDQTALAARCGMNANALKVAIHRLKRRFRDLLKLEITGTLDDPGLVEIEMRALFAALGN